MSGSNLLFRHFTKNHLVSLFFLGAMMSASTPVLAQTSTESATPECLNYPKSRSYLKCQGVIPMDSETGNSLRWQDLFNSISQSGASTNTDPAVGTVSTKAKPVQNADGSKIASEASVSSLFKAGQLIGNTGFAVTSLPSLPAGTNALGSVSVSNLPATPVAPVTASYVQIALVANTRAQLSPAITAMVNGVVCTAASGNTTNVLVGGSTVTTSETGTGNGYPILPGGSWSEGLSTTASTYFISTAAAVLFCHGN